MEEKTEGKMKSVASIPANYVSILELQERWLKEKERKQKGKELLLKRGVKQQIDGQEWREEGVMKVVEAMKPREKLKEKERVEKEEENRGDLRETKKNNPVKEDSIGKETQFQDRWTKKRVEEVNGAVRLNSGKGYYRNQRHDGWSSRRVIRETGAMVWVKKGKNDAATAHSKQGAIAYSD